MRGAAHEQDDHGPDMLAFGLGIVFGDAVEGRMAGAEELSNISSQELHFLGDCPKGVNGHGILAGLLDDVADDVGGDLHRRSPC
ncbi:hypothetical protein NLG97_g2764 [Lecanicillium saksenae]|uniref:Uncharacterized protein n=1 Tax=Lecanicillium saksenae TaxID=468837 RepID=A0ACC1R190_9HYPO|nr:hypothetical protein NLG97_g2764 [Lecanicillium saksenae]